MNKHLEKAMALRNEVPMVSNCAQTILKAYAGELGIDEELAGKIACNFGGGMKCGGVCGAITGGLMILGAYDIVSPAKVNEFKKTIANNHDGMINCADLLKANARNKGIKKVHCDNMIKEAIELVDKFVEENKH